MFLPGHGTVGFAILEWEGPRRLAVGATRLARFGNREKNHGGLDGPPWFIQLKAASVVGEQKPDQNVSFSANWIWRSRFAVSVISPAVPLMLVSEKTIAFGVSKFA